MKKVKFLLKRKESSVGDGDLISNLLAAWANDQMISGLTVNQDDIWGVAIVVFSLSHEIIACFKSPIRQARHK